MHALVLAATYRRMPNAAGLDVPVPLVDLETEPLMTVIVKQLSLVPDMRTIHVITNEGIKADVDAWARGLPQRVPPIDITSDGTTSADTSKGAVGDILFALEKISMRDDLLIVGADNWFSFELRDFVQQAGSSLPAVALVEAPPGANLSRFGMAKVDQEGRIVEFVEKPERSDLRLRSCCVYRFALSDLKEWLDEFVADGHSTICSSGVFLSWLIHSRHVPVHGFQMSGTFHDVDSPPVKGIGGLDTLEFRTIVRTAFDIAGSTWERRGAHQLQWVNSYLDLVEVLGDKEDPSRRIVAAVVLGRAAHLLNEEAKKNAVAALLPLLADPSQNDYEYARFECDENAAICVSDAAAESLVLLGYAKNTRRVLEKARRCGFDVFNRST